jgi:hypothetical protein
MVLILCNTGTEPAGQQIADALRDKFNLPFSPELLTDQSVYSRAAEWDDLLIVLYKAPVFPQAVQDYIQAFRQAHQITSPGNPQPSPGGFVLPVATDPANPKPPDPISGIKAVINDGTTAALDRITNAAGVFLGLALRSGEQEIFISYRATSGKEIANDLHSRLKAAGFHPWLDEAQDNLPPGTGVQAKIHQHIASAAMILVVDTPDAPDSDWVTEEINTAIGQLIPIVPVVLGSRVSRFIALASLQRCASLELQRAPGTQGLTDGEWQKVRAEIEEVLLSAYRRRLLILARAEKIFRENQFDWLVVEERLRMYQAERKQLPLPSTIVLSHCSIHDVTYLPALQAYADYVQQFPQIATVNYKLCVYDRERVLSKSEFAQIQKSIRGTPFILAHYNELPVLILSNFTRLRNE